MSAEADQAMIGGVTKKLMQDIDSLTEKLKAEAKMLVAQNCCTSSANICDV